MSSQLVSVVMSTYREKEEHLRSAIESVLLQSYDNLEFIIIVDDPENVNLQGILDEYAKKDKRIQILKNEKNLGPTVSRNKGINASRGEYIAIMDADDICMPDRIEKQINYFNTHKDISIVCSERYDIDDRGKIINQSVRKLNDEIIPHILRFGDVITNPTVIMRKKNLMGMKGYREIPCAEDYDLWLRCCSRKMKFHVIDEPLIKYRIRTDSLSHENYAKTWVSANYARKLFRERDKKTKDSFSVENYQSFVRKSVLKNDKSIKRFNSAYSLYCKSIETIKDKGLFLGIQFLVKSIFYDYRIVSVIINNLKVKKMIKIATKE